MEFFETVQGRRSTREFSDEEVADEDLMKMIDAGRRAPSGKNTQPLEYILIQDKEMLAKLDQVQKVFGGSAATIAIVADPEASRFWLEDASASAAQMLLAAHALGLASVWIEGTLQSKEEMAKELLGVPAGKRLAIMLPVGKAAAPREPKEKKPLDELVHRERYGQKQV